MSDISFLRIYTYVFIKNPFFYKKYSFLKTCSRFSDGPCGATTGYTRCRDTSTNRKTTLYMSSIRIKFYQLFSVRV